MTGGFAKNHAAGFSQGISPVKSSDGFGPIIEKGNVAPTINGQHTDIEVIQDDF
jgi:hypothetical protein